MNLREALKRYFEQLPKEGFTPQDVRDAVAAAGDISPFRSAFLDVILTHAEIRGGINPEKELAELFTAQTKAQTEKEETAKKEAAVAGLAAIAKIAQEEGDPFEQAAEIERQAAALQTRKKEKNLFLTLDQYLGNRAKREYWNEYTPDLFKGVSFPDGTISVIGASPGGGKSAALVNLCRELLTTKPANNPHPGPMELAQDRNAQRKILFISAEMTSEDIADRLIHSIAWQKAKEAKKKDTYKLETVEHTNKDYWNALKVLYGHTPDYWTFTKEEKERHELYRSIIEEYIRPAWGTRIEIAYTRGLRTFDEIAGIIKAKAEPGTLVLMDYLQLFPPMRQDTVGNMPRYLIIRGVMESAILAAEQTKSVILCAAQLGREERRGDNGKDETQGWRESGDIEQSAWNAIKLFKNDDQLFYKVVKARSGNANDSRVLEWIPGYQYMAWTPEKPQTKKKPSKNSSGFQKGQQGYTIED